MAPFSIENYKANNTIYIIISCIIVIGGVSSNTYAQSDLRNQSDGVICYKINQDGCNCIPDLSI